MDNHDSARRWRPSRLASHLLTAHSSAKQGTNINAVAVGVVSFSPGSWQNLGMVAAGQQGVFAGSQVQGTGTTLSGNNTTSANVGGTQQGWAIYLGVDHGRISQFKCSFG